MAINSKIGAYTHNLVLSLETLTISRRHRKLSGVEDKGFVGVINQGKSLSNSFFRSQWVRMPNNL